MLEHTLSRVLQAGQNPEGMSLTPQFFARGHAPEMSAPDRQIARGYSDMTPQALLSHISFLLSSPHLSLFCMTTNLFLLLCSLARMHTRLYRFRAPLFYLPVLLHMFTCTRYMCGV
jgi:hypothetical protein